jgi:hypothetical protein
LAGLWLGPEGGCKRIAGILRASVEEGAPESLFGIKKVSSLIRIDYLQLRKKQEPYSTRQNPSFSQNNTEPEKQIDTRSVRSVGVSEHAVAAVFQQTQAAFTFNLESCIRFTLRDPSCQEKPEERQRLGARDI